MLSILWSIRKFQIIFRIEKATATYLIPATQRVISLPPRPAGEKTNERVVSLLLGKFRFYLCVRDGWHGRNAVEIKLTIGFRHRMISFVPLCLVREWQNNKRTYVYVRTCTYYYYYLIDTVFLSDR